MDSVSEFCPSCKSSNYNNPQLRLMVNVCGHSLCENCVEVLFVRGSGLCFQCRLPIRKANFRFKLFDDPKVQKEIDIRRKIINEYNKREEDFDSIEEYDLYLETIELIIYKLANDIDVDDTRKIVEQYKKDNKDIIKYNKARQSSSQEFYEHELEREKMFRERREKEEMEEINSNIRLKSLKKKQILQGFFGFSGNIQNESDNSNHTTSKKQDHAEVKNLQESSLKLSTPISQYSVPPSIDSKHRFLPPPPGSMISTLQKPMSTTPASMLPNQIDPSIKYNSIGSIPSSSITPTTGFGYFAPPTGMSGAGLSFWATSIEHHNVHIPTLTRKKTSTQVNEVVFKRDLKGNIINKKKTTLNNDSKSKMLDLLQPYRHEIFGPDPPEENLQSIRWLELQSIYHSSVISQILSQEADKADNIVDDLATDLPKPKRTGLSAALPRGACGICPNVFLKRCLEDSRCGLFI